MTRAEIRARALSQAGEQEGALGEMAGVVNQYIDEGQRAICPGGLCDRVGVRVRDGVGELDEDVLDVARVWDAAGRERTWYSMENGRLTGLDDGEYEALVLREAEAMKSDAAHSALPERAQGAVADYATWRLLSNGGRTQQLRAEFYRQRFLAERQCLERLQEQRMGARRRVNRYR